MSSGNGRDGAEPGIWQGPLAPYPISGLVRRARRMSDMSQRQMARFARTSSSTVGKIEAGLLVPSWRSSAACRHRRVTTPATD